MALWEIRHERNLYLCECGYDITYLHIPAERNAHFARHHVYRRGGRLGKSFPLDRDLALGEDVEMALDQLIAGWDKQRRKEEGDRPEEAMWKEAERKAAKKRAQENRSSPSKGKTIRNPFDTKRRRGRGTYRSAPLLTGARSSCSKRAQATCSKRSASRSSSRIGS